MNYNEFAESIKSKYPEYNDMDNRELAQKMVAKYPEYNDVTFDDSPVLEGGVGINVTPSGLRKGFTDRVIAAPQAVYNSIKNKQPLNEAYNQALDKTMQRRLAVEKEIPLQTKFDDFLTDTAAYSVLPMANVFKGASLLPKIGNLGLTGAYQGGLIGGLESLKHKGDLSGVGAGAGFGSMLGSLPVIGGLYNKFKGVSAPLLSKLTGLKPETLQRAVKPDSVALDLTGDQAENLLMNTTERVRDNYNQLLAQRGKEVNQAVQNLSNIENRIPVQDLQNDISGIFNQYQRDMVNPARNMTGDLENNLYKLVESGTENPEILTNAINVPNTNYYSPTKEDEAFTVLANATGKSKEWIRSQLKSYTDKYGVGKRKEFIEGLLENVDDKLTDFPVNELEYYKPSDINDINAGQDITRRAFDDIVNGRFNVNEADSLTNTINGIQGEYKDILSALVKDPRNLQNYENALNEFSKIVGDLPEELQTQYMNDFIQNMDKIDKMSNSISPESLQGIKEQIGKMTRWSDEIARNFETPILEQLYGKYQGRLSDLSPELKLANENYANLRNFQNNEGLKRILRAGDNIDIASTALKNYNNTITKGNTNRNVTDLENVLVENGYQPFLGTVDDINAVQDLQNMLPTGINFLGVNNLLKGVTGLGLRGQRFLNQTGLPALYDRIGRTYPQWLIPMFGGISNLEE